MVNHYQQTESICSHTRQRFEEPGSRDINDRHVSSNLLSAYAFKFTPMISHGYKGCSLTDIMNGVANGNVSSQHIICRIME